MSFLVRNPVRSIAVALAFVAAGPVFLGPRLLPVEQSVAVGRLAAFLAISTSVWDAESVRRQVARAAVARRRLLGRTGYVAASTSPGRLIGRL